MPYKAARHGAGSSSSTGPEVLSVRGVSKQFGGVHAVESIELEVAPGDAVAVIGPNGAGKSTLLKLIAGVHRPTTGEIHLGALRLDRLAPHRIARQGVALAHQVPRPFSGLTVEENIRVGSMASRPRMRDEELATILDLCGLDAKAKRRASSLRVLDLKRLEVARSLATRPQVLMLDEVAAGLVGRELDEAIAMIKRIHATGVSLLLVEHIERVVREIVEQVVVLNWGRTISTGTPAEVSADPEVRRVYLGDTDSKPQVAARPAAAEEHPEVLRLDAVTAGYGDMIALRDISMAVREGEIAAVLGANGAGKSTLCSAIMGAVKVRTGSVQLFGQDVTKRAVHLRSRAGVAYCQEGRRIFGELSVRENLVLGAPLTLAKSDLTTRLDRVHDIFPVLAERCDQLAGSMSGGQQQMLAVGRALMADPRLLICDEISLGLAPVAIDALYDALRSVNEQGVSILLVEQNVQRSLELAHHATVLSRGRVSYQGDPARLLNDADLDAAYFGSHQDSAHLVPSSSLT
jgi:branched-chain amino acid transport system ATP-binding protein